MLQWHARSVLHAESHGASAEASDDGLGDALGGWSRSQLSRTKVIRTNRRRSSRRDRERCSELARPVLLNASLRQLLLGLVFIGIVGLEVELALLRHADSLTQWIPHVALMIGIISTAAVYFRPGPPMIRTFQVAMLIFVVAGVLGLYLHFRG